MRKFVEDLLHCSWNNKNIFEKVNLEINKGELIGIIGPSGSGKSTLVDIISGLLKPSDGKIIIDDKILGQYEKINCGIFGQHRAKKYCRV